jgi:hypothetical protein
VAFDLIGCLVCVRGCDGSSPCAGQQGVTTRECVHRGGAGQVRERKWSLSILLISGMLHSKYAILRLQF